MNKKGFTIIELLTVIAILGILVLLAAPKFLGYTEQAKLSQIKNDIKSHETFIGSELVFDSKFTETWDEISKSDLESYKNENSIYDKRGLLKSNYQFNAEKYLIIPNKSKGVNINTNLPGKFILDSDGDVYYQDSGETNKTPLPDTEVGCFMFEETESNATVIGYTCNDANVVIPSEYNGKSVTDIGTFAFFYTGNLSKEESGFLPPGVGASKTKIKKVVIPNSVINIQDSAFMGSIATATGKPEPHLESVELGENVQMIGSMSFGYNKIKSLKIPDSVVDIEISGFAGSFYLEDLQIGSGLSEIKTSVFSGAHSLNQLTIPGNVKELHPFSFGYTALGDITLEEGVEIVGTDAFSDSSPLIGVRTYCEFILPLEGKEDSDCNNIGDFEDETDPSVINIMNKKGFKLGSLNLPKSIIPTGEQYLFYGLKFNEINIENAEVFLRNSFIEVHAETLNIYNDLNYINEESFSRMYLNNLVIHGNVDYIDSRAFVISNIKSLELKGNVDTIDEYAFAGNNFVNGIKFEGSVNEIKSSAFYESGISNIILPDGLTTIEASSFSGNNISSLSIPNSVITIGEEAFSGNPLNSVAFGIGTEIQTVKSSAFERIDGGSVQVTAPMSKESIIKNSNSYINFVQLP